MAQSSARNIVICCDGTGNQYGNNNTNVVKIFEMLESNDSQKIFYDPGVGTSASSLVSFFKSVSNIFTQALGSDLQKNVEDAYYYLMNVYQPGDRIFLFGFSRGAHTVRRLANLLEVCELLHRGSENMIPYVSRMYLEYKGDRNKIDNDAVLEGFRKTFCRPCPVHFIGVWDTVSALSNLYPRPTLDGSLSEEVSYAYHAVAIDEKRLQFPPNLWNEKPAAGQSIEQVWFAGVHSDVGGSYKEVELSNIPLKWMAEKARSAGLLLKSGSVENIKTNPLENKNESWIGKWWFLPNYIYLAGFALAFYLVELCTGLAFFSSAKEFATEYWYLSIALLGLLIWLNQKKRKIPAGSWVHSSVKERLENNSSNYKPSELIKVLNTVKWV